MSPAARRRTRSPVGRFRRALRTGAFGAPPPAPHWPAMVVTRAVESPPCGCSGSRCRPTSMRPAAPGPRLRATTSWPAAEGRRPARAGPVPASVTQARLAALVAHHLQPAGPRGCRCRPAHSRAVSRSMKKPNGPVHAGRLGRGRRRASAAASGRPARRVSVPSAAMRISDRLVAVVKRSAPSPSKASARGASGGRRAGAPGADLSVGADPAQAAASGLDHRKPARRRRRPAPSGRPGARHRSCRHRLRPGVPFAGRRTPTRLPSRSTRITWRPVSLTYTAPVASTATPAGEDRALRAAR